MKNVKFVYNTKGEIIAITYTKLMPIKEAIMLFPNQMKPVFKVGEIVTHDNRRAEILGHEQSNLPCACCGRLDHNISLLAKILYLDDNSIDCVEFSSLKGNNENEW